jgi:hypothetical protein
MSPETIPWILCGSVCLLPILIGSITFFLWVQLTNRIPTRDVSSWVDTENRRHLTTEWSMLTREEIKLRGTRGKDIP